MIYLMNEKEVTELEFKAALKEDLSKIFGTDASIIHNLANEAVFEMHRSFKEVGIGDSKYQILYHPIKIVYVNQLQYHPPGGGLNPINVPYKEPEKWVVNDWPQPYPITTNTGGVIDIPRVFTEKRNPEKIISRERAEAFEELFGDNKIMQGTLVPKAELTIQELAEELT